MIRPAVVILIRFDSIAILRPARYTDCRPLAGGGTSLSRELPSRVNFPLAQFPLARTSLSSTYSPHLAHRSLPAMARTTLLPVLLVLLALVQLPEASAGVVDSEQPVDSNELREMGLLLVSSATRPRLAAAKLHARGPEGCADAAVGAEKAEVADQDSDEGDENEMPPVIPAPEPGHVKQMEPGQTWESRYRHGVAPAKLPALETDNAHGYRHSIIHPYGDDLHA